MKALTIATVLVAISGYVVIWVASQALPTAGYENFMVYWSLFFALAGILDGLMQETTRAVTAQTHAPVIPLWRASGRHSAEPFDPRTTPGPRHSVIRAKKRRRVESPIHVPGTGKHRLIPATLARPFVLAIVVGILVGVVVLATGPLWAARLIPDMEMWGVGLFALGLASYSFQATLCGLLSARGLWSHFAVLISIDSVIRLVLAVSAWTMGWGILAFLIVTVLGAATWIPILLFSSRVRTLRRQLADVDTPRFTSRSVKAMIASGANAVLITGFAALLLYTSPRSLTPGELGATITAVTLTRAPILVPLQRFQPALIVHFTKQRHRVLSAALLPSLAVIGVGLIGLVAAWFLARPLMLLFFKPDLVAPASTLGLLTLISAATAILMITGSATLAADRHTLYSSGWIIATLVAIGMLLIPASPDVRAMLALSVGPLSGALVHLVALVTTAPPTGASHSPTRGKDLPDAHRRSRSRAARQRRHGDLSRYRPGGTAVVPRESARPNPPRRRGRYRQ